MPRPLHLFNARSPADEAELGTLSSASHPCLIIEIPGEPRPLRRVRMVGGDSGGADIPRAQQEDACRGRGEARHARDRNSGVRPASFRRLAVGVVGTLVVLLLSVREGRAQAVAGVTVGSDCSAPLAEYLREPNPGEFFYVEDARSSKHACGFSVEEPGEFDRYHTSLQSPLH